MNVLLHSKTFRTNLLKWFIVYLGVLGIVNTVITYSRYITSVTVDDEARVAKFNIDVTNTKICSTTSEGLCNLEKYKPYDELEYYFTVDLSELEIKSVLVLNITIDSEYQVLTLKDVDNAKQVNLQDADGEFEGTINGTDTAIRYNFESDKDDADAEGVITVQLVQNVAPTVESLNYIVKVKLKNPVYSTSYENKFVKIGYSATQVD